MEIKTLLVIAHLFGLALGAGGAWTSDALFFRSTRNGKISKSENKLLSQASVVVWVGLAILIVSGIGLFLQNPDRYAESTKFWSKMTIVAIIAVNGLIFHFFHKKSLEKSQYKSNAILVSGVVSMVSWASALILGAFRSVPLSYLEIMGIYLLIVASGSIFGIIFKNKLLFR